MQWREIESEFANALRTPDAAVPAAVSTIEGPASVKRFNVYRNNVAVSLTEALAAGYPVVKQLVGEQFFTGMACTYVSMHLPKSPVMLQYGADFPDFIENFTPASTVPFLADVARIECSWHTAYHAEDCDAISLEHLQAVAPECLDELCLRLHPSLQLLTSQWPAVSIWQSHQTGENTAEALKHIPSDAEAALIVRPRWHVEVRAISPQAFQFFHALQMGTSLGDAAEPFVEADNAEMGHMLQILFESGSVIELA